MPRLRTSTYRWLVCSLVYSIIIYLFYNLFDLLARAPLSIIIMTRPHASTRPRRRRRHRYDGRRPYFAAAAAAAAAAGGEL